jgi:hypothetical protein
MKAYRFLAFMALLSVLYACAPITPPEPNPAPEPVPVQNGTYVVRELDQNGKVVQEWETKTFRYRFHPKSVEFMDGTGQLVRLMESFEIVQKP